MAGCPLYQPGASHNRKQKMMGPLPRRSAKGCRVADTALLLRVANARLSLVHTLRA